MTYICGLVLPIGAAQESPVWIPTPAGGFVPTDIPGCKLWTNATEIAGLSDGDPVSTWLDLSGQSHNATQSGAARPIYKTAIQNGLPVVRGDGTQNLIAVMSLPQPSTIFIAGRTDGSNDRHFLDGLEGSRQLIGVNSNKLATYAGGGDVLRSAGDVSSSFQLIAAVFDGASSAIYSNGSLLASGLLSSESLSNALLFGGNGTDGKLIGDEGEVIAYDTVLSSTNRNRVGHYLERWGIPWVDI